MKNQIDFIQEDTKKGLIKMTLPILVSLVLNMVYSIVDSVWIGNMLGEKAMAALTSSTAVILLLTCIFLGMTNGMAILLSQALGAKDKNREASIQTTSLVLFFFIMLIIVIVCESFLGSILVFLKTPKETFSLALWYLRIYLIGVIPSFIINT